MRQAVADRFRLQMVACSQVTAVARRMPGVELTG